MDAQSSNPKIHPNAKSRESQTHLHGFKRTVRGSSVDYHTRLPEPPLAAMPEPHFSYCQCCKNTFQLREELRVFKEEARFMWTSIHKYLVEVMKEQANKK